ncbi:MAG TPA: SRPBCC domain-containing protein [Caulobacteraceae bacterium]|nr:SRPBCC domain-containing protein [Caulobacteraceae bacterium]
MTETSVEPGVLVMTRYFDASPERVFQAWTDPELSARWLFTTPQSEAHSAELDVRVGGRWTIVDRRGGVDYRALGEYLNVDPPRRLVFTFGMPQFSPGFTTVKVEIAAAEAGSVMTLAQEDLPAASIPPLEEGWRAMFETLVLVAAA